MNYYYDLLLNFLDENCMFYEWDETDAIEFIKKIPLFHVDSKVFNDFYTNKVKVEEDFLKLIDNKTVKKDGNLKYSCILADKNNAIAYEFNNNGEVITRSSLLLVDELNLLDYLYTVSVKEIKYEIIDQLKRTDEIRMSKKVRNFIQLEIDKLYEDKVVDKLKFLYLEWFNKKEMDIDKIYKEMTNKLKKEMDANCLKIYNIIKLSYNNV